MNIVKHLRTVCPSSIILRDYEPDDHSVWVTTPFGFEDASRIFITGLERGQYQIEFLRNKEWYCTEFAQHHAFHFLRTLANTSRLDVALIAVQAKRALPRDMKEAACSTQSS